MKSGHDSFKSSLSTGGESGNRISGHDDTIGMTIAELVTDDTRDLPVTMEYGAGVNRMDGCTTRERRMYLCVSLLAAASLLALFEHWKGLQTTRNGRPVTFPTV